MSDCRTYGSFVFSSHSSLSQSLVVGPENHRVLEAAAQLLKQQQIGNLAGNLPDPQPQEKSLFRQSEVRVGGSYLLRADRCVDGNCVRGAERGECVDDNCMCMVLNVTQMCRSTSSAPHVPRKDFV